MRSPFLAIRALAIVGGCLAATLAAAAGHPRTVCTITVNSPDEKETFRRHLPPGDYRFVELVERGRKDWMASACEQKISCDALIISGHFDGGDVFYSDRVDTDESLSVDEMERASCSNSCPGVFANLKEVYLFGCNTLKPDPQLHAASNRDKMRQIFHDVPVIYGFSSKAPLGRYAGPVLDRYFQAAPAGEVGSGKPSATLLGLFAPVSMAVTSGVTDSDPQVRLRVDTCHLADDRLSTAQKVDFLHEMLGRDMGEVKANLEQLEHFVAGIGPTQLFERHAAAAFARIADDAAARGRYLESARQTDEPALRMRMMALARKLAWLTPEQESAEFVQMLSERVARGLVGRPDVDLACERGPAGESTAALQPLATAVLKSSSVAQAAALACLGNSEAHARVVRAVTSANPDDIAVAQTYLRRHPLTATADLRAIVSAVGRMPASVSQVRALETLSQQRISDPESLRAIASLFPLAKSVDTQRAIAGILIRSDHRVLGEADLARTLKRYRIKSPDGEDVIDALLRVLHAS